MKTIRLRAVDAACGPTRDLIIEAQDDLVMLHLERPGVGPEESAFVFVQWSPNGWEVVVHEAGDAAPNVALTLPDDGDILIERHDDGRPSGQGGDHKVIPLRRT